MARSLGNAKQSARCPGAILRRVCLGRPGLDVKRYFTPVLAWPGREAILHACIGIFGVT
jgi:hypothetical protein